MKQIFLVLVYCFVLGSSCSIREESMTIRKLKQTVIASNTSTKFSSSVDISELSTESYSTKAKTHSTVEILAQNDTDSPETTSVRPAPPHCCVNAMPRNINARYTNGRLTVVRATSLDDCCEYCRRYEDGLCRSWWRADRNGSRRCFLNRNG